MDTKHIISFENGTLFMKVRESFNPSNMQIHCTMARIDLNGVQVVKADSKGEISSTSMSLTPKEFKLLAEGSQMVDDFWYKRPLPKGGVLLSCGCIVDWDEHNRRLNEYTSASKDAYLMPYDGDKTWCDNHEEARILRFNVADFAGEEE